MHLDINNPKIRWAQYIADVSQEDQAIVQNMFGDYDIKRAKAVVLVNNPNLLCIIEPKNRRQENTEFDCVLG